jgi:hypothetical protein
MIVLLCFLTVEECTLRVSSSPPDLQLYIDSVYQGNTPITICGFKYNKKYYIELKKEDYTEISDSIVFTPLSRVKEIKFILKTQSYELSVEEEARMDAEMDVNKFYWNVLGGMFGIGILLNELVEPEIPEYRILNKEGPYLWSYLSEYKREKKRLQGKEARNGCILGAIGGCGFFLFLGAIF